MHILYITPEYPHAFVRHSAGIGSSLKNLAMALAAKGHNISIIVYGQERDVILYDERIKIHLIAQRSFRFFGWYYHRKYIQKYVNTLVCKEHVDLIEAADWTGITAFMNLQAPLIIRLHGSDTYFCHLEQRKQKVKNYLFERLAMLGASGFIAPTNFAGKLSKSLLKLKFDPLVIHYGLDLSKFVNDNPCDFETGLILYIGTIIRKKGVLELPAIMREVWKINPDARIVLIGADSADQASGSASTSDILIEQLHRTEREKFIFSGKIPYENVVDYIRKANVCVFPTFAETLGMVTIESMAMQKPVVSSNMGWVNELLEHNKSGFMADPRDHEEFASYINNLIRNPELVHEIGAAARNSIDQNFDINEIVNDNISYYEKIIAR